MKIAFIGMGNQASAILKGMRRTGKLPTEMMYAYDLEQRRLQENAAELGFHACGSLQEAVTGADAVVLAVKPHQIEALLQSAAELLRGENPFIISMAAGRAIARLEENLYPGAAVARIMPNQNAALAQSVTAYCINAQVTDAQETLLRTFCGSFGDVMPIEEALFSAFFVLAGAGPAFVFLFIDQLTRAAVKAGMPRTLAQRVAAQTVLGSAQLVLEDGAHPQALIDRVCSPGGITIEGIAALQEYGFENAVNKAMEAAYCKDKKLQEAK